MLELLLAASVAGVVGVASVPLVIRVAQARGLLDRPDSGRRWHPVAVPRLGGIAVWIGAVAGFGTLVLLTGGPPLTEPQVRLALAFLAGLAVTFGAGMYDDLRGLSPRGKLAAQCVAAVILVAGGFNVESIAITSQVVVPLGWLAMPATLLWIVGVTNAFNLVDGLDGLAGGIAIIALITIGIASVLLGNPVVLALILPLAAAIVGFLRFNVSPARIFLGDVGSLTLGLTLAVLTMEGTRRPDGAVYFPVALFAVAFPLLDTCTAMLRRWLRGVPVTAGDDRHVHHQLVALGLSHRRAAALIWLFAALMAGFGLSVSLAPPALTLAVAGFGAAAFILIVVHGVRWLHYHEFSEAQASFTSGMRMARSAIRDRIRAREVANLLRDASSLEEIGLLLEDHCREFGFEALAVLDRGSDVVRPLVPPAGARRDLLRLEWPIRCPQPNASADLVLCVSWSDAGRIQSRYAERVAGILVPAIANCLFGAESRVDRKSVSWKRADELRISRRYPAASMSAR